MSSKAKKSNRIIWLVIAILIVVFLLRLESPFIEAQEKLKDYSGPDAKDRDQVHALLQEVERFKEIGKDREAGLVMKQVKFFQKKMRGGPGGVAVSGKEAESMLRRENGDLCSTIGTNTVKDNLGRNRSTITVTCPCFVKKGWEIEISPTGAGSSSILDIFRRRNNRIVFGQSEGGGFVPWNPTSPVTPGPTTQPPTANVPQSDRGGGIYYDFKISISFPLGDIRINPFEYQESYRTLGKKYFFGVLPYLGSREAGPVIVINTRPGPILSSDSLGRIADNQCLYVFTLPPGPQTMKLPPATVWDKTIYHSGSQLDLLASVEFGKVNIPRPHIEPQKVTITGTTIINGIIYYIIDKPKKGNHGAQIINKKGEVVAIYVGLYKGDHIALPSGAFLQGYGSLINNLNKIRPNK